MPIDFTVSQIHFGPGHVIYKAKVNLSDAPEEMSSVGICKTKIIAWESKLVASCLLMNSVQT